MKTLIVPCGGKSSRYPGMKPKWLLTHPDGRLMIAKALEGLNLDVFDRIIIVIVKPHAERYEARLILEQVFASNPAVEICQLEDFTRSAAETVSLALRRMKVEGSFVIKDSDNFVAVDLPADPVNAVVGYDIACDPSVPNPCGKSFLQADSSGLLKTIVEKKVISSLISVGVYLFDDAERYEQACGELAGSPGETYVSDVISRLLRDDHSSSFRVLMARAYEDWGTLREWRAVQRRSRTYFVDVDGVLMKNSGRYGRLNWSNNQELLADNVQFLRKLQDEGAQIVITTSRTEECREPLELLLRSQGLCPHAMIMGLHHAERIVINDFAPTNPYPSCEAISLPRDGNLRAYFE